MDVNDCGKHVCTLGGCREWNKRFLLQGAERVQECRGCREHRAECPERTFPLADAPVPDEIGPGIATA